MQETARAVHIYVYNPRFLRSARVLRKDIESGATELDNGERF